jgi:hypothetical protein
VKLVNHEARDFFIALGNHSDAIALSKAANELVFGPGEFKAVGFDS